MTYKLKDGFVLRKVGPMYMAVPFGTARFRAEGNGVAVRDRLPALESTGNRNGYAGGTGRGTAC